MKNPSKNDEGVRSGESISLQDGAAKNHQLFDIAHLERQVLGDIELRDELLRLYAGQLVALAPLICGEPGRERSEAAHALKGASLAIGAFALAHLCHKLELKQQLEEERGGAERREAALLIEGTRRRVADLLRP